VQNSSSCRIVFFSTESDSAVVSPSLYGAKSLYFSFHFEVMNSMLPANFYCSSMRKMEKGLGKLVKI
jgi:hypothetical protein